ncbi:MAG: tetratricopeptide repeat protein [Pirellulales bacterium]|nr:tetratricopeptide repeat protein [Pirellulales bacterium]
MKWHCTILAILIFLSSASASAVADTVTKKNKKTVLGQVSAMSNREVTVKRGTAKTVVPAGEIRTIVYDGEPKSLSLARASVAHGQYEDALKALSQIDTSKIHRKAIVADVEFYKALAAARLALRGEGKIVEAGTQMAQFVKAHHGNYHWYEANRIVGDLLVVSRLYGPAVQYYTTLADAPWLSARLRAAVGIGRAEMAAGKIDEAAASFQKAIEMSSAGTKTTDADALEQKKLAQIGKARCLAAQGKLDDALKMTQEIIDQADPEDVLLNARAYNALGTALRKAGKPQDALLAFLHVDILYFNSPEEHAEALANLAELWGEVHQTDRAIRAQETLRTRYKNIH